MKKLVCALALLSATFVARAAPIELADLPVCLAATPAAISTDKTPVSMEVRVLLDGVSLSQATGIVQRAQKSYTPQGITLNPSYETVSFNGIEGADLIAQAKAYYGGQRPSGIDLVYVLTDKDITSSGDTGLAGLADCIGGVKYSDRAFAVGEASDIPSLDLVLYKLSIDKSGKTMAHELGHLLGAHHHLANCAEAAVQALGDSPCTLMMNYLDFQYYQFSTINGAIVRGLSQSYAKP